MISFNTIRERRRPSRLARVTRLAVALFACTSTLVLSSSAGLAAEKDTPNARTISAQDFWFGGAPKNIEAGTLDITFVNRTKDSPHLIDFIRLAPGHENATKAETIAAIDRSDFCPSGCFFNEDAGGAFADPASTSTGQATLRKGRYAYVCFITEPNGTPHYHLGMFGFTRVHGDS